MLMIEQEYNTTEILKMSSNEPLFNSKSYSTSKSRFILNYEYNEKYLRIYTNEMIKSDTLKSHLRKKLHGHEKEEM